MGNTATTSSLEKLKRKKDLACQQSTWNKLLLNRPWGKLPPPDSKGRNKRPLGWSIYPAAQFMMERERVGEGVESGGGSLPHGLFNKSLFQALLHLLFFMMVARHCSQYSLPIVEWNVIIAIFDNLFSIGTQYLECMSSLMYPKVHSCIHQ